MGYETSTVRRQAALVEALGRVLGAPTPIETHISYVLLSGDRAFKIKKAVDLGFLDFSTLEQRRHFCKQEVALNRRFAPALYLGVVPITGTPEHPQLGGEGAALEYAVEMRQFPQEALLSRVLARGELKAADVDALAAAVAAFHARAEAAPPDGRFGSPEDVLQLALENFTELGTLASDRSTRATLDRLRYWTMREHAVNTLRFGDRRRDGFVRACHGDLHLDNIALIDGEVTLFDGIEFNDRLRWTDVMADVAFVVMDFHDRRRPDFAARFLNAYLEHTGDYAGLRVLRFYLAYRAMVRAKVARMREEQSNDPAAEAVLRNESIGYLALAESCAGAPHAGVVITHGPSGSGKTTVSQGLLELVGAIRIRTDVERKRRHGLDANARTGAPLNAGLYAPGETDETYRRVRDLAHEVVASGYPAIADGTFLRHRHRQLFAQLAAELRVPFAIIDLAPLRHVLRARIADRRRVATDASDADERVLELQLAAAEPLDRTERRAALECDPALSVEDSRRLSTWKPLIDRLGLKSRAA